MTRRLLLAALCVLVLVSTAGISGPGADETWLTIKVVNEQYEPLPGVSVSYWVGGIQKPAKLTGATGEITWSLLRQTATRIDVDAWVVEVDTSGGSSWINGDGITEVSWATNPARVVVTIIVDPDFGPAFPSPTPSAAPSLWPTITPTPEPSATPLATYIPDPNVPHVIIKAERTTNIPGRTVWTYWPGGGATVVPYSADGDAWVQYGPTPYQLEASGDYVIWYVTTKGATPDLPPSPPEQITVIVTATPGTPAPTAQSTALPGVTPCATLTLHEAMQDWSTRYMAETDLFPVVIGVPAHMGDVVDATIDLLTRLREAGFLPEMDLE